MMRLCSRGLSTQDDDATDDVAANEAATGQLRTTQDGQFMINIGSLAFAAIVLSGSTSDSIRWLENWGSYK